MMTKRIVQLKVTEGSVVPRGANQRAHIRLWKMDATTPPPANKPSLWKRLTKPFATRKGTDMFDVKRKMELQKKAAERKARIAKIRQRIDELKKARLAKNGTTPPAPRRPGPAPTTGVRKGATVAERLAKIRQERQDRRIVDLQKKLDEERGIRLRSEYLAKADSIHVAGKVSKDDIADVLQSLSKLDSRTAQKIEKMLVDTGNAWREAARQLTKELGRDGDDDSGGDGSYEKLRSIAKGIKDKTPGMTDEQAFVVAMKGNPELAKRLS